MSFLGKLAFGVFAVVVSPAALVVAAYETVTEDDKPKRDTSAEMMAREQAVRRAAEKRAEEERKAIVAYARESMAMLQAIHSKINNPSIVSFSFQDLRSAVRSDEKPIEILGRWILQSEESDPAAKVRRDIARLDREIAELENLRQAVSVMEIEDLA
jgi:hypothetical protein